MTGFLGLNGSGKTTTLRMLLGLTRPTSGKALINNERFRDLSASVAAGRCRPRTGHQPSGADRPRPPDSQAIAAGAGRSRVDTLLEYVGLADAADQRSGDYSLGMRQRLAVATALLGDPSVLILDEPANGLDPEGIAWLRQLLRDHARAGGTVLISSHLLAELAQLIDDVVIIANGRSGVRRRSPAVRRLVRRLRVRGRDPQRLWQVFEGAGGSVTTDGHALEVIGLSAGGRG